ncbi:MAG TPA: HipA N-terminal domain-containing protein [Ramlibacter sp.]|nr:HipA N-terminal domain-containing protein [Ramlibacter sp.]
MIALAVWLDQAHVGQLTHDAESNRFAFAYAREWLETPSRFPLSPQLPLEPPRDQTPEQHSAIVRQLFENLLPEGEALDHAAQAAGTSKSNLMGLLIALGKETAGAVRVTLVTEDKGDQQQKQPGLRLITPEQLSEKIRTRQEVPFSASFSPRCHRAGATVPAGAGFDRGRRGRRAAGRRAERCD